MKRGPVNPHRPAGRAGRAGRWAGHREQRRAELVESAIEAIRERGAGVSVAGIAAAAGVTKPVLYRHFTDRADLQRAVSERAAKILLDRLLPELATERDPMERIRAIVDAFLAAIEDEPELWRFVVHNPGGEHEASADVVAHNLALIAGLITTGLVEELRARRRDAGGAEAWAYGIAGMVYTAGDWWLQRRTMTRAALTDYLTELIWGGLSGVLGLAGRAEPPAGGTGTDVDPAPAADAERPLRLVAGDEEE
ncbi:MAG: TetR/AcrR family transcriptional regulator [Pseudonocardia sp.]|nr:TetR/AcrR family transcriptional regulator [Pseudonocardia sp.]